MDWRFFADLFSEFLYSLNPFALTINWSSTFHLSLLILSKKFSKNKSTVRLRTIQNDFMVDEVAFFIWKIHNRIIDAFVHRWTTLYFAKMSKQVNNTR